MSSSLDGGSADASASDGSSGSSPVDGSADGGVEPSETGPGSDAGIVPTPISGADGVWTWVDVPGAMCADGSPTGFAVNLEHASNELFIFLEGAGACWDANSCYVDMDASYVTTGYDENTFETGPGEEDVLEGLFVTNRSDSNNPFPNANYAYFPDCTGDVHAGNNVMNYVVNGAPTPTHHVGYVNTTFFFQALAAKFPSLSRIWLGGYSAGGLGAVFNWGNAHTIFPGVRIDVLNDSGSGLAPTSLLSQWISSWNLQFPSGCTACTTDMSTLFEYYTGVFPNSRLGYLEYTQDTVNPGLFGESTTAFTASLYAQTQKLSALPNARYYLDGAAGHVLFQDETIVSQGVKMTDWVGQMVSDSPAWANVEPPMN